MRAARWLGLALWLVALGGCSSLPLWMVAQGQSQISDHRHFDIAPLARAAQPQRWPSAPAALRWPGGLGPAAAETDLAAHGTVALLVLRRGQLVYEGYFNGYSADSIATSFSMA